MNSAETAVELVQNEGPDITPVPGIEKVKEYIRASKAENTLRGYRADWKHFCDWSTSHDLCPLPAKPEAVALFIAECAEYLKTGSIQRRLNAIAEAHKAIELESPTRHSIVVTTLKGIRRTLGSAPTQKSPAVTDDIRAMMDATSTGIIGLRDRALILLGFAGAFRRSELVSLDVADCEFGRDGLTIILRRSKNRSGGHWGKNRDSVRRES
jgi:site-specific recombinase XerD